MSTRFVNIDRTTPMLLPPDLRDWVQPSGRWSAWPSTADDWPLVGPEIQKRLSADPTAVVAKFPNTPQRNTTTLAAKSSTTKSDRLL
jgi:hypothetical protein